MHAGPTRLSFLCKSLVAMETHSDSLCLALATGLGQRGMQCWRAQVAVGEVASGHLHLHASPAGQP